MTHAEQIAKLKPQDRECYEERAGIMEFDGKMPRAEAERIAFSEILKRCAG